MLEEEEEVCLICSSVVLCDNVVTCFRLKNLSSNGDLISLVLASMARV